MDTITRITVVQGASETVYIQDVTKKHELLATHYVNGQRTGVTGMTREDALKNIDLALKG